MRIIQLSKTMTFLETQELVAETMKRPSTSVEIGYEAPWSAKVGSKKTTAYITNEPELQDFWLAYKRHSKSEKVGKRKSAKVAPEIVFRNLRETLAVRLFRPSITRNSTYEKLGEFKSWRSAGGSGKKWNVKAKFHVQCERLSSSKAQSSNGGNSERYVLQEAQPTLLHEIRRDVRRIHARERCRACRLTCESVNY